MIQIIIGIICAQPFVHHLADIRRPVTVVSADQLSKNVRVMGRLELPIGTATEIHGLITDGPTKGYDVGLAIRVFRVADFATQKNIVLPLRGLTKGDLDGVMVGQYVAIKGFESGEFVGIPEGANHRKIVSSSYHYMPYFTVDQVKKIDVIHWSPTDFINRTAMIIGQAETKLGQSYLVSTKWQILVDDSKPWPKEYLHKTVAIKGLIRGTSDKSVFRASCTEIKLVRLEDQLNMVVELRGRLLCDNNKWLFEYMGNRVHIESIDNVAGFSKHLANREVAITGVLETADLPDTRFYLMSSSQLTLAKSFIVKKAKIVITSELLAPEIGP